MSDRSKGPIAGMFIFLFGTLLGGIIALFAATDEEGETREEIKFRLKVSKARVRGDVERIKELVADTASEVTHMYEEARVRLEKKLADMKTNIEDVDFERYSKAVNDVISEMRRSGSATATQLSKMQTYMLEDYSAVTSEPKPKRGRPKKTTAKKATKKSSK